MCISRGNFDSIFFLGVTPFLNLKIWQKWKILLFFLLAQLHRISWNLLVMKDIMCRYAVFQEMLIWSFWGAIYIPFLSDCPSLMLGIAIHCIQHSQAMLERGVCELAHSFFHSITRLDVFKFFWVQIIASVASDARQRALTITPV